VKLRRYTDSEGKPIGWAHWCPACNQHHVFNVEQPTRAFPEYGIKGGVRWKFNGNEKQPTFHPSMLIQSWERKGKARTTCHYHLQDGRILYCADSPHALRGKTVPLPDVPNEEPLS
jgi:hypothetical protein